MRYNKMRLVSGSITEEIYDKIRLRAFQDKKSMSRIMAEAIENYLR